MESYCLLPSEMASLDAHMDRYLRVMLKGKACARDGAHFVVWSRRKVMAHWHVAPTMWELRARRLKRLQHMCSAPANHEQVISALWGTIRC